MGGRAMNKLDLRQIGTIMGMPIYVDVASIPYYKRKKDILSNRDIKEAQVTQIISDSFNLKRNLIVSLWITS
jgi:hypothetical protein